MLRDPEGPLRAGLTEAGSIGDPLSHFSHIETPVKAEAETTQIALGVLVKVEGMEGAAETGFKIAQQDVDLAELGEIIGMTATFHDSGVVLAFSCNVAEARQPIRENGAAARQVLLGPISKRF